MFRHFAILVTTCLLLGKTNAYQGFQVGMIQNDDMNIAGTVYILDCSKLVISGFRFMPEMPYPSAVFLAKERGAGDDAVGFKLLDGEGVQDGLLNNNTIYTDMILHMPHGKSTNNLFSIEIWNSANDEVLASSMFPDTVVVPAQHVLGPLSEFQHGVSGMVIILNERQIQIKDLTYDGQGPDAYFYVGKGTPDGSGQAIPDENGGTDKLGAYSSETVCLTLPEGLTVFDIDYLAVFCIQFSENFGHVMIPTSITGEQKHKLVPPMQFTGNCYAGGSYQCVDGRMMDEDIDAIADQTTTAEPTNWESAVVPQFTIVPPRDGQAIIAEKYGYRGLKVGSLTGSSHDVAGTLYFADCQTLVLGGFTIIDPPDDTAVQVVRGEDTVVAEVDRVVTYRDSDIMLEGPILRGDRLVILDRGNDATLGEFLFTQSMSSIGPAIKMIGSLSSNSHGVNGDVFVVNEKQLVIKDLFYDGLGPDPYFYVGRGTPDANGMKIPDEMGNEGVLKAYSGADICLTLPGEMTVFDIDYIAVWCVQYSENFGSIQIPQDRITPVQAWLNSTECNLVEGNKCPQVSTISEDDGTSRFATAAEERSAAEPETSPSLTSLILILLADLALVAYEHHNDEDDE